MLLKNSTFLSHMFFVAVLCSGPLVTKLGGSGAVSTACSVLILSISQHLRLVVHPMLVPPKTSLLAHLASFVPLLFTSLATCFFMRGVGVDVGYKPVHGASLTNAFFVVFSIFVVYLLLAADLSRKHYSRHWANVALLITLLSIKVYPFHLNPIITLSSAALHGGHKVYATHIAALLAAVVVAKAVESIKASSAARLKQH
jgi:hypothetical protein